MALKVYEYKNCSTCKSALKFLDAEGVGYEKIPIVDAPPPLAELEKMLGYLKKDGADFKKLFNTSGQQYRELKISERLAQGMTESEALKLLSQNGKLIKRPFLLGPKGGAVGFRAEAWKKLI